MPQLISFFSAKSVFLQIQFAYYASSSTTKKPICCHCAADNSKRDADLLTKFPVVLPICNACRNDGNKGCQSNRELAVAN